MSSGNDKSLRPRLSQLLNRKAAERSSQNQESVHFKDAQTELRAFLEKSRVEGKVDRSKLRELTDVHESPQVKKPIEKLRLSAVVNPRLLDGDQNQGVDSKMTTSQRKKNSKMASTSSKEKPNLRDSIYFPSEREYESYLLKEMERHGLFRDCFERLKMLYVSRKDLHALMMLFEHLPEMNLSECQIHLEKAEVFRLMSDMDKAYVFLDKAIRVDPNSVLAIRSLFFYHKLRDEYDFALHWLQEWKKHQPKEAEIHYQFATVYQRLQQNSLALFSCKTCLEIDPKHTLARSLLDKLL